MKSFDQWDREIAKAVELLPRCCECDEAIQSEYCYEIDGQLFCEECVKDLFRVSTENYII